MTTSNIKDAGWFCHAPNKPRVHQEIALPPTSQIPGLSELPPDYHNDEPKKMVIKDTDTKYITLCKMGGRSDLLRMPSPKPKVTGPKPYSTVDWFYLEDIRKEEAEKKDKAIAMNNEEEYHYQPLLPEYMVHKEYAPKGEDYHHAQSRNPLSRDQSNVFQREGNSATNKNVKIAEPVPNGYGIRQGKNKNKSVHSLQNAPVYQRAKGREAELDNGKSYAKPMKVPSEEERPLMSKILSYGYQKEWEKEHDKWQSKQEELRQQMAASVLHTGKVEKPHSEYQSQTMAPQRVPSHGRRAPSGSSTASHRRTKQPVDSEQPSFFSLPQYDKETGKKTADIQPMSYDPTRQLSSVELTNQRE